MIHKISGITLNINEYIFLLNTLYLIDLRLNLVKNNNSKIKKINISTNIKIANKFSKLKPTIVAIKGIEPENI